MYSLYRIADSRTSEHCTQPVGRRHGGPEGEALLSAYLQTLRSGKPRKEMHGLAVESQTRCAGRQAGHWRWSLILAEHVPDSI